MPQLQHRQLPAVANHLLSRTTLYRGRPPLPRERFSPRTETGHDLDFIFEKDGVGYGVEVKNTLGYLDVDEFVTKIRLARHIGLKPVFAVRFLPKTWAEALIQSGGYAMIMKYQFYPLTHKELANQIRDSLGLPVDTPRRIEDGTMQRFEAWTKGPVNRYVVKDQGKVDRLLDKIANANKQRKR